MKTKNLLTTCCAILLTSQLFAQRDAAYGPIEKDVCACMSKKDSTKANVTDFRGCISEAMNKNGSLLVEAIGIIGDDSAAYQRGVEYGRRLAGTLDTSLINSCDAYFNIVQYNRRHEFDKLNQDSLKKKQAVLAAADKQKSKTYDQDMAIVHFLLKDYNTASLFADKVLAVSPANDIAQIIKGYYFESLGKFGEAAKIYRHLAQSTRQNSYWVWAVYAERKQRELLLK